MSFFVYNSLQAPSTATSVAWVNLRTLYIMLYFDEKSQMDSEYTGNPAQIFYANSSCPWFEHVRNIFQVD